MLRDKLTGEDYSSIPEEEGMEYIINYSYRDETFPPISYFHISMRNSKRWGYLLEEFPSIQ